MDEGEIIGIRASCAFGAAAKLFEEATTQHRVYLVLIDELADDGCRLVWFALIVFDDHAY